MTGNLPTGQDTGFTHEAGEKVRRMMHHLLSACGIPQDQWPLKLSCSPVSVLEYQNGGLVNLDG